MPETTENYHRLPNPNYNANDFRDEGTRTASISEPQGILALWAPLERNGQFKVRTFLFKREQWPTVGAARQRTPAGWRILRPYPAQTGRPASSRTRLLSLPGIHGRARAAMRRGNR